MAPRAPDGQISTAEVDLMLRRISPDARIVQTRNRFIGPATRMLYGAAGVIVLYDAWMLVGMLRRH